MTIVVLKESIDSSKETLSSGWYITVVSLTIAIIGVPGYITDICMTVKTNMYKNNIMNIRPRETKLTENQAKRMVDSFNNQMDSKTGHLPEPLGLRGKFTVLYHETDRCEAPRPTTPIGDDEMKPRLDSSSPRLSQPMIIPAANEYRFGSIYDEDFTHATSQMVLTDDQFVHPPPKLISDDISLTDILRKNFHASSSQHSPCSSRRSSFTLQGGQLDDSDLEIYLLTKGFRSHKESSAEDRPSSREAFKKQKRKKKHKESSKTVGDKSITEISHDGLPTIKVIGPDYELHDFKEPISGENNDQGGNNEVEDGTSRKHREKKRKSSRSNKRKKLEYGNKGYHSNDDYKQSQDQEQNFIPNQIPEDENDDTERRRRKKSSKRKKHKRDRSTEVSCVDALIKTEKIESDPNDKIGAAQPNIEENIIIFEHRHSSKKKKRKRDKRNKTNEEVKADSERESEVTNDIKKEGSCEKNECQDGQTDNFIIDTETDAKNEVDEKGKSRSKKKKHKKSKKRHKPYLGDEMTYDVISYDYPGSTKIADGCNEKSLKEAIDDILDIPLNPKSENSKL